MNVDFSKNFSEDNYPFEFEYEKDRSEFNNDSYSNELYNNFSSKMNSPNFLSYETNEEFIENFLKIGNLQEKFINEPKKSIDISLQNKTTTKLKSFNFNL